MWLLCFTCLLMDELFLCSFNVLPVVEEVLPYMRSGDTWQLSVPGSLGFGEKGRPASAGKPRIPSNADLDFTLELVAVSFALLTLLPPIPS